MNGDGDDCDEDEGAKRECERFTPRTTAAMPQLIAVSIDPKLRLLSHISRQSGCSSGLTNKLSDGTHSSSEQPLNVTVIQVVLYKTIRLPEGARTMGEG